MRSWKWRRIGLGGALAVGAVATLLAWHGVDDSLSAEDRQAIPKYLADVPHLPPPSRRRYRDEIGFIAGVQRAVFRVAPRAEGLPYDAEREPLDLLQAGHGVCYDRSRVIEEILRYAGFDVRHISLYSTAETGSALASLLTAGTPSHAVSEVRTKEGWLVVDSNDPWISLDAGGRPVSMRIIEAAEGGDRRVQWQSPLPNAIYERPFTFVYGLYSRHGRFYPPYDFVPDVNYRELIQNIW